MATIPHISMTRKQCKKTQSRTTALQCATPTFDYNNRLKVYYTSGITIIISLLQVRDKEL